MMTLTLRRSFMLASFLGGNALLYVACGGGTDNTQDGGTDATADTTVPQDSSTDSGKPTDSATDSPVDAGPACTLSNPFGTPVELTTLNPMPDASGATRGARLSTDYLTAYYELGAALFTATRTMPSGDTFGSLATMGLSGDAATDSSPTVSSDGLTLYFASDRGGISQIYFATRSSKTNAFGAAAPVTGLMPAVAESSPFLQGDGSSLYFVANIVDSGTNADIYRASVTSAGVLSSPVAVAELNTAATDGPAAVTANGLTAYFSRLEEPDGGTAAHFKIWTANRTSTALPFSGISPVPELNGPDTSNDDMAWVSNDGCQVTLSSFRAAGSQTFIATKP